MNITRPLSLAAALVITVSQWALCLALFIHIQPLTAITAQSTEDIQTLPYGRLSSSDIAPNGV
jgi:hypothetical protein